MHTREDENHWRWYLADLEKLGYNDQKVGFVSSLRFIWSDSTIQTRLLSYQMCRLGFRATSIRKLVLVHCIEAAGKVTVSQVAAVGTEFGALTGKRLVYLGQHHSDTEGDHTLEDVDVHRTIEEIALEPEMVPELLALVDETFGYFKAFTDDALAAAKRERWIDPS